MRTISPINFIDFYKADHKSQYPEGTTLIYSNLTPRGSRIKGIDKVVVFGIQYFVKEYLINRFNLYFFNLSKEKVLASYKHRLDTSLGQGKVNIEHIGELHDLGYLPIKLKALKEGSKCPMRVPLLTLQNTLPAFFWLTNYLETLLSTCLWQGITSATVSNEYRTMFEDAIEKTGGDKDMIPFQAHDFSFRGMSSVESALLSGAGHLLSFLGTDTLPAIDFLEEYYSADSNKELIGCSVPATEHSVMCMGEKENEIDTFTRLIHETYPNGIVSIVADTWDFWKVMGEYLPKLKKGILERDGTVVIRPDSGDPVKIICGDPDGETDLERKGAWECLWDIFGGTTTDKGFKLLDSHINLIYGDSITMDRCKEILSKLIEKGFVPKLVLGIGSFTFQYNTRDTFGFAMKATYGQVGNIGREIYKDPKTDDGLKKSARGLIRVYEIDGNN